MAMRNIFPAQLVMIEPQSLTHVLRPTYFDLRWAIYHVRVWKFLMRIKLKL